MAAMDITEQVIADSTEDKLAIYAVAVLRRLGQLGLDGRVAIGRALEAINVEDFYVQEGLLQMEDLLAHQ